MGITYIRKLLNSLKKWEITAYEDIDTIEDLRNYLFDETDSLSEKCNHMIDSAKVIEDSWTKKVFFHWLSVELTYWIYENENEEIPNTLLISQSRIYFYYHLLKSEGKLQKQRSIDDFFTALEVEDFRSQFLKFLSQLGYCADDDNNIFEEYFVTLSTKSLILAEKIDNTNFLEATTYITEHDTPFNCSQSWNELSWKLTTNFFETHIPTVVNSTEDINELKSLKIEASDINKWFLSKIEKPEKKYEKSIKLLDEKIESLELKFSSDLIQKLINKQNDLNTKINKTQPLSTYCDDIETVLFDENPAVPCSYFNHVRIGMYENQDGKTAITIPIFESKALSWNLKEINPEKAFNAIQNIVTRMVMAMPKGHIKVRIVDEDMGANFQMLLGLPEEIKGNAIYYDSTQIMTLFGDLKKRDSKIIFEKLKNQYNNLIEFNIQNEFNYEPIELIIINGLPLNFNEQFLKYISNQIQKGCKSGCYYLFVHNPDNLKTEENNLLYHNIVSNSVKMGDNLLDILSSSGISTAKEFKFTPEYDTLDISGNTLNAFSTNYSKETVNKTSATTVSQNKQYENNSSKGIIIPIGKTDKGKSLELDFSENSSAYHGIICGTTGSGKTVMLHQIITSGSTIYTPDELQFVLLDYKLGTEFNVYKNLPHARVVAIDADIEFGNETLKFLSEIMKERSDAFKKYGTANLEDYRNKSGLKCPRILVIIDEFQVLLEGSVDVSRIIVEDVRKQIDSIVRLGRSFGIHLLLSTQTPSGVKWSGSTMENIALRIGLRMSSESEAYLFKHQTPIPSQFTQKYGKAVYNDKGGVSSEEAPTTIFNTNYVDPEKVPSMVEIIKIDVQKSNLMPTNRTVYENNIPMLYKGLNASQVQWSEDNKDIIFNIGIAATVKMEAVAIEMPANKLENVIILGSNSEGINDIIIISTLSFISSSTNNSKIIIYNDSIDKELAIQSKLNSLNNISNSYLNSKEQLIQQIDKLNTDITNYNSTNVYERCLFIFNGISNLNGIFDPADFVASKDFKAKIANLLNNGHKIGLTILLSLEEKPQFNQIFGFMYEDFENSISFQGVKNMYKRELNETYELKSNMGIFYQRSSNKEIKFNRISLNNI
jgi:hypothetical protein